MLKIKKIRKLQKRLIYVFLNKKLNIFVFPVLFNNSDPIIIISSWTDPIKIKEKCMDF